MPGYSSRTKQLADDYWRQYLAGFSVANALPLQNHGPQTTASAEPPTLLEAAFDADLTAACVELARRDELTVSVLMQCFWALTMADVGGDDDVVFGYTVSGRAGSLSGIGEVVGSFINTLPVRIKLDPDMPVLDWLKAHHQQQVEQQDFAYSPLVDIQGCSDVARGAVLFESLMVYENYPVGGAGPDKTATLQAGPIPWCGADQLSADPGDRRRPNLAVQSQL